MRGPAGRSADAARAIKKLIVTSVEQVNSGSRLVAEAGQAIDDIVARVRQVDALPGEISRVATDQAAGVGQVNSAEGQLDDMTQQNAPWWSKAPRCPAGWRHRRRAWRRPWRFSGKASPHPTELSGAGGWHQRRDASPRVHDRQNPRANYSLK